MRVQTRETALQGEYVRLYVKFIRDGQLRDPYRPPAVFITDNDFSQNSSSSSTTDSSAIELVAQRESTGVWFVDWLVPINHHTGRMFDVWTFDWDASNVTEQKIFKFEIHSADDFINWVNPNVVHKIGAQGASMLYDLNNLFLYEAQHIPVYREQGIRGRADNNLVKYHFFCNRTWNDDPAPLIYQNNQILETGWYADYKASIYFNVPRDPEDIIEASYYFRYFSDEELMQFLLMGLFSMNAIPPSSQTYSTVAGAPYPWRAAILLYAAIMGLRRMVFGLNFQEKSLIFGEQWDIVQQKIGNLKELYKEYQEEWKEQAKNIKTMRLPGIGAYVSPEYTLPGGRSRWFRYLYKN